MIEIANIYPVKNQSLYKQEKFVMILAHLVKAGYYKPENFSDDQYIIMDNGLFEKAQVSTDLQDLVDLAENSGIPVDEIIVPDAVNDLDETIRLFEQNLPTIRKWQHKYKFMFVAQADTYEDLHRAINYIGCFDLNLSVGISKLSPLDRADRNAINAYVRCPHPIHFLGIKTTFKEILPVSTIIRSCDTSQLAFMEKNNQVEADILAFERDESVQQPIDLEHDNCDELSLKDMKCILDNIGKLYGFLE